MTLHFFTFAYIFFLLTHFGASNIESYIQPRQSTFSTAVSGAIKVLKDIKDEWEMHGHSPSSGSRGEESPVPSYFKNLYDIYVEILSGATFVVTQSEQNHQIQKTIIGSSPPIGADTRACARTSSNANNKKNGHPTVERGKRLPTALLPASSEEDSDFFISEGAQKNKGKKKQKKTDPQSTIEKHTQASANITNAVVSLIGTMGSGNKEGQDDTVVADIKQSEMNLKKEQFEHSKDIETKKFEFIKLQFEQRLKTKELERNHTRDTARIELLKLQLQEAKDDYRKESVGFLKDMAKDDVTRAHVAYVKALSNLS